MALSRKICVLGDKIEATLEVQKYFNDNRVLQGPLGDKATLIHSTTIAASSPPSNAANTSAADQESGDINEVIYLLPYYPDQIHFWVDERKVNDPSVTTEEIREGKLDDYSNCSVIEIKFISNSPMLPPREEKTCDIYIPPSALVTKIWIYRDPKKRTSAKEHKSKEKNKTTAPNAQTPSTKPKHGLVTKGREDVPKLTDTAVAKTAPISSKRDALASAPETRRKQTQPRQGGRTSRSEQRSPEPRRVRIVIPEPEGFKNDYLDDLSRVSSKNGAFCFLSTPDSDIDDGDDDDDEYGDDYDDDNAGEIVFSPLDKDLPPLPSEDSAGENGVWPLSSVSPSTPQKKGLFGLAGRRARRSVFHERAQDMHGDTMIDISPVKTPMKRPEFAKPSFIHRIVAKIIRKFAKDDIH